MIPVENEDRSVAGHETTNDNLISGTEGKRDWLHLIVAHLKVAALCPALAASIFWALGPERNSLLQLKGIFAFVVTVGCTYLFFGVLAVIAVLLVSPVVWLISKIPGGRIWRVMASALGAGLGWLVCEFSVNDMPAFQIAVGGTAAYATGALEKAWRRTANVIKTS